MVVAWSVRNRASSHAPPAVRARRQNCYAGAWARARLPHRTLPELRPRWLGTAGQRPADPCDRRRWLHRAVVVAGGGGRASGSRAPGDRRSRQSGGAKTKAAPAQRFRHCCYRVQYRAEYAPYSSRTQCPCCWRRLQRRPGRERERHAGEAAACATILPVPRSMAATGRQRCERAESWRVLGARDLCGQRQSRSFARLRLVERAKSGRPVMQRTRRTEAPRGEG
mmetsp:Transcript_20068/g.64004  ORF Transcript_20068/g.64004 Transcript_20068/m.64004 type:complete len:224 (+) Transcript_20068:436-1107(+)